MTASIHRLRGMVVYAAPLAAAPVTKASFHLFRIEQIFSNADRVVQFVVLHEALGADGKTLWLVVGWVTLTFTDGNDATFAYSVDCIEQTRAITRQLFAMPATVSQ